MVATSKRKEAKKLAILCFTHLSEIRSLIDPYTAICQEVNIIEPFKTIDDLISKAMLDGRPVSRNAFVLSMASTRWMFQGQTLFFGERGRIP